MNLFFSSTMRCAQISLTILILCLAPNERTMSQELSPATKKLFEAINKGDLVKVKISIDEGANYKAVNAWGITPVDLAVDKGHIKIIHYLLQVIPNRTSKTELLPVPTPSRSSTLKNSGTAPAEPTSLVNNGLSAVAEVYSPPPDAGPWSAAVVTTEPPSNMKRAEVTNTDEESKSALQQIARNFPLSNPMQPVTSNSPKKPQINEKVSTPNKDDKKDTSLRKKDLQGNSSPASSSKKSTRKLAERELKGVTLKIGQMTALNKAPPPQASNNNFYQSCINRKLGSLVFCIENLNWPDSIRTFFLTDSILSEDTHTIVRYDRGAATYFHTLFPSKSYMQIIDFFTKRYGAPTNRLERSIAPLAEKRRINPTATRQSISPATKLLTTLEVRMYDDNRGDFPDTERGAVYLYNEKSQTIFPHISLVELMLLRAEDKT